MGAPSVKPHFVLLMVLNPLLKGGIGCEFGPTVKKTLLKGEDPLCWGSPKEFTPIIFFPR